MTDPHRTSRRLWITLILVVLAAVFALAGCSDVIGINDPELATFCVVWVDGADLDARGGIVVREASTDEQRSRCRPLIVMRFDFRGGVPSMSRVEEW